MKNLPGIFMSVFCLLGASAAFGAVEIKTDCNSYGPTENSLAVAVDEDFVEVGHIASGVFFPLRVSGCQKLGLERGKLLCDGIVLGSVANMESTSDDDGRPRADLKIIGHRNVSITITGSCDPKKKDPLTFNVLK